MHQAQIDKATPRPWKVQGAYIGSEGATIADCHVSSILNAPQCNANASLIVTAVNERALLLAIAEAAQSMLDELCGGFENPADIKIKKALESLNHHRKSGGK